MVSDLLRFVGSDPTFLCRIHFLVVVCYGKELRAPFKVTSLMLDRFAYDESL
jgi:hypothetical protein